ncbi:MAG: hypothetical protein ACYCXK_07025 [Candidatus Humimicrobiaceae bacterium]
MGTLLEDQLDLKLKTRISGLTATETEFNSKREKENIRNFYNFCKKFFSLWDRYLERISPLLSEFNHKASSPDFKQVYAEIISEQYEKFFKDLANLEIPRQMSGSFKLFLDSIKYKREFYDLYSNDPENKRLDNIKNESILVEEQFWLDIYRKNSEIESHFHDL